MINDKFYKAMIRFLNGFSKLFLWIAIGFAVILMVVLNGMAFYNVGHALLDFNNAETFLPEILHAFEYFFVSPIALIILFSCKDYLLDIFPKADGDDKELTGRTVDSLLAEKVFISSIIGVTSTFILSKLIALFNSNGGIENNKLYLLLIAICFLILEVLFFRDISSHRKEQHKTQEKDAPSPLDAQNESSVKEKV